MELSPELRPIIEAAQAASLTTRMVDRLGKPLKTEGEIRPTDMVPVIAPDRSGKRTVYPMVWGFPTKGAPVYNCRIESAAQKPLWKDAWASHRCIVPASYYFEWEHFPDPSGKTRTGRKFLIQPKGSPITWLAGLYRIEEFRDLKYPVFAVMTREPSDELRRIHDRMPLVLPEQSIDAWIQPDGKPEDVARAALTDMVFEEAALNR